MYRIWISWSDLFILCVIVIVFILVISKARARARAVVIQILGHVLLVVDIGIVVCGPAVITSVSTASGLNKKVT